MFTRQLMLIFAGGLLLPPIAESAPPARARVIVRLYNTARVPTRMKEAGVSAAARTLAANGVDITWADCDTPDACAQVPVPGELVVRLVRSHETPRLAPLVLGEAFIDAGSKAGVLATIYVQRVEQMAALSNTDVARLLGRAIAHEVGHLLLASNTHTSRGLMRARWSPDELRRNDSADWLLTEKDAAAIRQRLMMF
ncbi:MAG TPA: hypothetical protein VM846_04595 [Vicinamibacterales bacterium]|nr:hypothetical protein [Vicinamibacterales bacterium]